MQELYEISERYIAAGDTNALLYEPIEGGYTFQRTRSYEFKVGEGAPEGAVEAFVTSTLFDDISQELHQGGGPVLKDYSFILDYGMKPGALDLEKEAVLSYYRGIPEPGFELEGLRIRQRLYVFGVPAAEVDAISKRFVKDICNPAIHHWTVTQAHA